MRLERRKIRSLVVTTGLVWALGCLWSPAAYAQTDGLPDEDAVGTASGAAGEAGDTLGDAVGNAGDAVSDAAGTVGSTLGDVAGTAGAAVGGDVGDAVGDVGDALEDATGDVGDTVDDVVDETADTVDEVVDETTDAVDDATGDGSDDITDPIDDVTDGVGGVSDGILPDGQADAPTESPTGSGSGPRGSSSSYDLGAGAGSPGTAGGSLPVSQSPSKPRRGDSQDRTSPGPTGGSPAEGAPRVPLDAFARILPARTGTILETALAAGSDPSSAEVSAVQRMIEKATQIVTHVGFPMALALIVIGFITLQGRVDRRDPKLALAPVDQDQEVLHFE